jgi:hypothetical protein
MRDQKTSQKKVLVALQTSVTILPNIIVPNILRIFGKKQKLIPVRAENKIDKRQIK